LEAPVKTRLLAIPLAMMAGCGSNKPAATAPPAPAPEVASSAPAGSSNPGPSEPAASPDPAPSNRPRPEIGNWGFDLAGMDTSVAPGASFYRYANGKWLTNTQIPADKADYGMFTMLADRSEERTRQIIESASGAPGSDGQRIAD